MHLSRFESRNFRGAAFQIATVLAVTLALRLLFFLTIGPGRGPGFFSDDALITLRYAQNLAAGHGFVYNHGEYVLGTTTPLYALLMTLPALLGMNLMFAAAGFNAILDGFSSLLFWKALPAHASPLRRLALTLVFAAHPVILRWSQYGMETSLLVFLAFLTARWYWKNMPVRAGAAAALMVLTRPDALLFAAALALAQLLSARDRAAFLSLGKAAGGFFPVLGAWIAFSLAYFQTVLPHSILAKRMLGALHPAPLGRVLDLGRGMWLLPACMLGVFYLARAMRRDRPPPFFRFWALTHLLWAALLLAFFAAARAPAHLYEWYRVPLFAALAVVLSATVLASPRAGRRTSVRIVASLIIWGPVAYFLASPIAGMAVRAFGSAATPPAVMHLAIGRWLGEHAPAGSRVMAGNIGFIGYFSGAAILDDVGLVSPQVTPILARNGGDASPLIARFRPDYLAFERREWEAMAGEIRRQGCEAVYEVTEPASPLSPYRIYRCVWE